MGRVRKMSGSEKKSPQTEQITARVEVGLKARMKAIKPKGFAIGRVWSVAAELLLALPEDDQHEALTGRRPIGDFGELVRSIVRDEIRRGEDDERRGKHRNDKPGPKDRPH